MKKILFTLITLFLLSISLLGQDEIRKKQFLIGGFVSPGISNYAVNINVNNFYVPGFSYNFGAEALFQIKSKFSLSIGIQYAFKNYKTKDMDAIYGSQIDPRRGFVFSSPSGTPTKVKFNYNDNYIDIPIRVDFYLNRRKIAPVITTGISTNLFIKEKVSYTYTYLDGHKEQDHYNTNKIYQPIHLELQLGMGVDIALSKSRLRIFPIYKRSGYYNSFQLGINYFIGV